MVGDRSVAHDVGCLGKMLHVPQSRAFPPSRRAGMIAILYAAQMGSGGLPQCEEKAVVRSV